MTLLKRENITDRGGVIGNITHTGTVYVLGTRNVTEGSVTVTMTGAVRGQSAENVTENGKRFTLVAFTANGTHEVAYGLWPASGQTELGTGYFEVFTAADWSAALSYARLMIAPAPTPVPSPVPAPAPAGMTEAQWREQNIQLMTRLAEASEAQPVAVAQAMADAASEKLEQEWTDKQQLMRQCVFAVYEQDQDLEDLAVKAQALYEVALAKIESVN